MDDPLVPDTQDWTWVLDRPCPDCGFDAGMVSTGGLGARVRNGAALWPPLLAAPSARVRTDPAAWSVLEYAAHVRDVHRVFDRRLQRMLTEEDPVFDDWDQDATAVEERYGEQDPAAVAAELLAAADAVARTYDGVPDAAWGRPGRRSNGSVFTVETLGRYHLHDLDHHAWDVRAAAGAATVAAYDVDAAAYAAASAPLLDAVRGRLDDLADRLGPGARVLEIGSAAGRDADHLEARGLSVRRSDVTPAFVDRARAAGHRADVLDPLVDDLADPERPDAAAYDGVWANACLLHVARADLPTVLTRLAQVVRPGGVLAASLKEGDGEGWSTHGSVAAPRRFVYWRRDPLIAVAAASGWRVESVDQGPGVRGEHWLLLTATRG